MNIQQHEEPDHYFFLGLCIESTAYDNSYLELAAMKQSTYLYSHGFENEPVIERSDELSSSLNFKDYRSFSFLQTQGSSNIVSLSQIGQALLLSVHSRRQAR